MNFARFDVESLFCVATDAPSRRNIRRLTTESRILKQFWEVSQTLVFETIGHLSILDAPGRQVSGSGLLASAGPSNVVAVCDRI